MNKFKEAIRDLRRRDPRRSIGFGVAKAEKGQAMLLGAIGSSASELAGLAGSGARLLILDAPGAGEAAQTGTELAADGTIAGARLGELDADGFAALKDAGFSFVISPPEATAASATTDDACGSVTTVSLDTDESTLRAFGGLSVDALFVEEEPGNLTIARQARIVRLSMLASRPLVVQVAADVSDGDLQVLRNSGVAAVVVAASAGADSVRRILEALQEMPPRKESDQDERHIAIVPGLAGTHHDHDADDD